MKNMLRVNPSYSSSVNIDEEITLWILDTSYLRSRDEL